MRVNKMITFLPASAERKHVDTMRYLGFIKLHALTLFTKMSAHQTSHTQEKVLYRI